MDAYGVLRPVSGYDRNGECARVTHKESEVVQRDSSELRLTLNELHGTFLKGRAVVWNEKLHLLANAGILLPRGS